MKADCLALVNGENETLWTRAATCPRDEAALALSALEASSDEALALIQSFTDGEGTEQFVELMTPWARASLNAQAAGQAGPDAVVVEVWQARTPTFGLGGLKNEYAKSDFDRCADVLVPHDPNRPESALDTAYASTQNIDSHWRPGKPCRSTSVGDILVLRTTASRRAYVVANLGFEQVMLR